MLGKLHDAREARDAAQVPAKRPVPPSMIMRNQRVMRLLGSMMRNDNETKTIALSKVEKL